LRTHLPRRAISQPRNSAIRLIALTQDQIAIVSSAHFEWAMQWKWIASKVASGRYYVTRRELGIDGKYHTVSLHRSLYQHFKGAIPPGMEIDHRNRNPLDNRLHNLRPATHRQNTHNRSLHANNRTGVRGVYWDKTHKHYSVMITFNGRQIRAARCKTLAEAKRKRKEAEKMAYKEFRPR
jgi:HNH endonuclease